MIESRLCIQMYSSNKEWPNGGVIDNSRNALFEHGSVCISNAFTHKSATVRILRVPGITCQVEQEIRGRSGNRSRISCVLSRKMRYKNLFVCSPTNDFQERAHRHGANCHSLNRIKCKQIPGGGERQLVIAFCAVHAYLKINIGILFAKYFMGIC